MIESIITDYLKSNRRLVVPGLGAFLRKEGGELVFVPFLNKDDGILSGLVRQTYGSSLAEADEIIEQYVEQVRTSLSEREAYLVVGLGSLKRDANGILFLDTADHSSTPVRKEPVAVSIVEPVIPEPEEAVEEIIVVGPVVEEVIEIMEPPKPEAKKQEIVLERATPAEEVHPSVLGEKMDAPKTFYDRLLEQKEEKDQGKEGLGAGNRPHENRPPGLGPTKPSPAFIAEEPLVGEDSRSSSAFARTESQKVSQASARPTAAPRPAPVSAQPKPPKPSAPAPQSGKKKADLILILAIVVAAIAVAAMIYAYAVVDLPVFNLK